MIKDSHFHASLESYVSDIEIRGFLASDLLPRKNATHPSAVGKRKSALLEKGITYLEFAAFLSILLSARIQPRNYGHGSSLFACLALATI